jgi:hypothetical protein
MRQWVLSVPFPLRFLFSSHPAVMGKVLGIIYRTIATHLTHIAGFTTTTAKPGAVTLIQRFGSALRTRPAVSTKRLSMTRNGRVRYEFHQKKAL